MYPKPIVAPEQESAHPSDESVGQLMIVSSNRALSGSVEQDIRSSGRSWDISIAHSPQEALEVTSQQPFSCVVWVESKGGVVALDWIPKFLTKSAGGGCPLVLVTDTGSSDVALDARRAGASSVLSADQLNAGYLDLAITSAVGQWRLMRVIDLLNQQVEERQERRETQRQRAERFAHELLTPLASVQEYISLVFDEISGPLNAEQASHLAYARGGCASIEATVEALMDAADNQDMNLANGRAKQNGDISVNTIAMSVGTTNQR